MKKIISLFLTLAVLCTGMVLAGCESEADKSKANKSEAGKTSVAAVINNAIKKSYNLDSISAVMKMEMNMKMQGMDLSIPLTANIKAKNVNGDDIIAYIDMKMSMLGQEAVMQMYQEGGWTYMVMQDVKYKSKTDEMQGQMDYATSVKDILQEIPEELLKDVKIVKGEGGRQTVTISVSGDKFTELYGDVIDSVNSTNGVGDAEVKVSNAVIKITEVDGFVLEYDLDFSMDMEIEGVSASTEVKMSLTFDEPGKDVVITPPEGYQDFEELDDGSLM